MSFKKGKPLSSEEKKLIIALKHYFDRNKSEFSSKETSVQMVSDAFGVGTATIFRIMAEYNKDPSSIEAKKMLRGRPDFSIDASQQEIVRAYIRAANMEGTHIALETIYDFLQKNNSDESFHITTLAPTLDRWGFEYGKGVRTQHLKEKDSVVARRHRYLRKMRSNRANYPDEKAVRPEIYLDESYVNKNHSNDFTWYSSEDGPWIQKPTGNGERFIIMNAITKDGWVPNAQLVFKSTRKTGDYRGQMNFNLFKKWFSEKLLPNIPPHSLIIMDNASYHNVLTENSAPISTSSKKRMLDWLSENKISCSSDSLKSELIEVIDKFSSAPTYEIDVIAKSFGHEIVRTPPYHPELQPIEICWGVVKNEIARNCDFTMKNLETQLEKGFEKVTADTCSKIIKKVRKIEDKFWVEDMILDEKNDSESE